MTRLAIILASMLALAACSEAEAPAPDADINVRGEDQVKLHQLSDMNRDIALKRAIMGTGYRCKRVTESGFVGPYENMEMWTATCDNGNRWAIFIGADDTAQVRLCSDVESQGIATCTIKREENGDATANAAG